MTELTLALVGLLAIYMAALVLKQRKGRKDRQDQRARISANLIALDKEALYEHESRRARELEGFR